MKARIIGTDGKSNKELVWVEIKNGEVYLGTDLPGASIKNSYHASGKYHSKIYFNNVKEFTWASECFSPSGMLKGKFWIFNIGCPNNMLTFLKDYSGKKTDLLVWVDYRTLKKSFNIDIFLLEPGYKYIRKLIMGKEWINSTVYLETKSDPWLLVLITY